MFTRIFSLAALALLTGCGHSDQPEDEPAQLGQGRIPCARGAEPLRPDCTVEQARGGDVMVLTIRHPDGGFRRLRVTSDGRGVVAADGALPAAVTIAGSGEIEVAIAGERYRLPATVKARS